MRRQSDPKLGIGIILSGLMWIFLLAMGTVQAQSVPQLLDDKQAQENVQQALNQIYGYNFDQTDTYINKLKPKFNNHPVVGLLKAINLYWSLMPISTREKEYAEYKTLLNQVSDQCDAMMVKRADNPEPVFFQMTAMMMLAKHESDAGEFGHAVNHSIKAYNSIKKAFKMRQLNPEFYFSCGLYSYFRELYPELNPFYRPFMKLFMPGSKEQGIKDIEYAAKKSVFCKPEAYIFLTKINLYFENKPPPALENAKQLVTEYPKNTIANLLLAEAYASTKQYDEAEKIAKKYIAHPNPFYRLSAEVVSGTVAEYRDKNLKLAKTWYLKTVESGKPYRKIADNPVGLAYAGMARIAIAGKEQPKAKAYYRKAEDLCAYQSIKNEAKIFLQTHRRKGQATTIED